jgi:uncharacterized integral membrane protein
MQRTLIFALITAIILVIFTIQNADPVDLKLWFWEVKSSQALIILITLALGSVIGVLVSIPSRSKKKKEIEQLKKEIKTLKENNSEMA